VALRASLLLDGDVQGFAVRLLHAEERLALGCPEGLRTGFGRVHGLLVDFEDEIATLCTVPPSLAPHGSVGDWFDCVIGPLTAISGQHTNTARAEGQYGGATYDDTDRANYFGLTTDPAIVIEKSTNGIGAVSLDDFCKENEIRRLDFIKIDTDGHELEVLKGAQEVIAEFRPTIIFEAGFYMMEERNIVFSDYLEFFRLLDYSLFNSSNLREIDATNYRKHIPSKATIDILALFRTGHEDN